MVIIVSWESCTICINFLMADLLMKSVGLGFHLMTQKTLFILLL